jgi:hypothetical protein
MKGVAHELIPATPPVAITGLVFMGIPIQDWVCLVTLVYTAMLTIRLVPKVWATLRGCSGEGR